MKLNYSRRNKSALHEPLLKSQPVDVWRRRLAKIVFRPIGFAFYILHFTFYLLFFPSCGDSAKKSEKYPGFFQTEEGVHYRIHSVGESGKKPGENDWLELQMINTVADSTIYDSELDNARGTLLMPFSGNKYFHVLSEGDSATFILPAGGIFAYDFDSSAQLMRMNVKLVRILTAADAEKISTAVSPDPELDEQKMMAVFLRKHGLKLEPDGNGLYFKSLKEGTGTAPQPGEPVSVRYSGQFLNGQVFDRSKNALEFNWGAEKQVLRGLEIAIARMKSGGEAMILLPSQLAFGKEGSGDGRVKPYTPVVYYIEIIENKP
ncbi:MAG: FKBP-type peptidylprolyl isomerase [Bacteroidetes bacterium]|nr:MAG: FKBP-type peptidylprolyl isomerase [Bacteroidota bacterium]